MKTKLPKIKYIKDLQKSLGIAQDGILGKVTINAIKRNKLKPKESKRIDSINRIFE